MVDFSQPLGDFPQRNGQLGRHRKLLIGKLQFHAFSDFTHEACVFKVVEMMSHTARPPTIASRRSLFTMRCSTRNRKAITSDMPLRPAVVGTLALPDGSMTGPSPPRGFGRVRLAVEIIVGKDYTLLAIEG